MEPPQLSGNACLRSASLTANSFSGSDLFLRVIDEIFHRLIALLFWSRRLALPTFPHRYG